MVILEKAPRLGGTAKKAAFWYWVPNNDAMQAAGTVDPKTDFLRYCARLSRPAALRPEQPDAGPVAVGLRRVRGHLRQRLAGDRAADGEGRPALPPLRRVPDYWSELPEDKAPDGRVLLPEGARAHDVGRRRGGHPRRWRGGAARRRRRSGPATACSALHHRRDGAVVGVEATRPTAVGAIRARKAVIFATGGFTHNVELRQNFLARRSTAAAPRSTNEGDFVYIASALGAQLRNMNYAWMCPISLEKAVERRTRR